MPFPIDTAAVTLRKALDALADDWPAMQAAARERIAPAVLSHARQISAAHGAMQSNALVAFLEALWTVRDVLPRSVVGILAAGQGVTQRLVLGIPPDTLRSLQASILRVVDPRYYVDPGGLVEDVRTLLTGNQTRLSTAERAEWILLEDAYRRDRDPERCLEAVEARLGHLPALRDLIARRKSWVPMRNGFLAADRPGGDGARPSTSERALGRFANVHFPATVLLAQQLIPLVIHIAVNHDPSAIAGDGAAAMSLEVGPLTVLLHAEGFTAAAPPIGGRAVPNVPMARTVNAFPDRDCEPIVFLLRPQSTGLKHLSIDVYQLGRNIGTIGFDTAVVEQFSARTIRAADVSEVELTSPGPHVPPPDLELRVLLSRDRHTLTYILHSPGRSDYNFQSAGQVILNRDPRDMLQAYGERLSRLASRESGGRSADAALRAVQDLNDLGANLYDQLFPRELKEEYRRLRSAYAGKSLLITSDEPWIPWELVRPVAYAANGDVVYDDPFLCETFRLSHWLAGRGAPDQVALATGALVAPPSNLAATQQETEYFARLKREHWGITIVGPLCTLAEVQEQLNSGKTQFYHFACHGNFDTSNPDESRLLLADGALRPSQLVGSVQGRLRQARPVVFLNACYSGSTGFALTGLGGWAERFIQAGASVFIGSMWEISDQLAARFAVEFYNRLWGIGNQPHALPLGEAFYQARLAIKQADPANPTWLAYTLYGDPRGAVRLGN